MVYPGVKINVQGVLCCALLDTGAGSLYASVALLEKIPKRYRSREVRRIEMMLESISREVELSIITVQVIDDSLELAVDIIKMREGSFW